MHRIEPEKARFQRVSQLEENPHLGGNLPSYGLLNATLGGSPRRILVVQTSMHGLGGSVIGTGVPVGLKAAFPHTQVDVIAGSNLAYENLEGSGIQTFSKADFSSPSSKPGKAGKLELDCSKIRAHIASQLSSNPYDALLFLDKGRIEEFAGLTMPLAVVLSRSVTNSSELALEVLTPHHAEAILLPQAASIYEQGSLICRALGIPFQPHVGVSENDKLAASALVPTSAQRVFYVHPGTSLAQKELSLSDWKAIFSSVLLKLASRHVSMDGVLLIVSPGDCPRHEALADEITDALRELLGASGQGAVLRAPKANFGLLRGLVDRADGVICADTVVSHMARALQKPCCTHFSNPVIIPEVWQPSGSELTQNFRMLRDSPANEPRERMAEGIARMFEGVRR